MNEYINSKTKIRCLCKKHNIIFYITPNNLLNGHSCKECGKEKQKNNSKKGLDKFKLELKEINKNIEIIGEYINNRTKIKCKCKIDGYEWFATPTHLLEGKGCPVCSNQDVLKGVNDISTTHPHIASMIVDESDKFVTFGSGKVIKFKCPECGSISKHKIANVTTRGFSCPCCSDGISYPNKFMYNLLSYLNIDFIREYRPDWCFFYKKDKLSHGIYDFYIPSKNLLIEMDGAFHFKTYGKSNVEESRYIDDMKTKLANEHGCKIIRIDCNYNNIIDRKEHIENNVRTKLNDIFDLSLVDFNKIDIDSCNSIMIKAIDLWNQEKSMIEISKILNINPIIVSQYIKKGDSINLCKYIPYKFSGKKAC